MRVLHLTPSVGDGGAEAVARMLLALGNASGAPSSLHPRLSHEGRAPWPAWLRWSRAAPADEAVVHAHLPWPDRLGAALLAARGRPMVVTFHLLPTREWPRDRVLRLPSPTVLRLAARRRGLRWVALSRRDQDVLRALGVTATVIRNAPPVTARSGRVAEFPDGALRLASVGRLHPQKGFDRMLDALAKVPSRRWHWCIAGDGESLQTLAAQRDRLGLGEHVSLLGRRPAGDVLARAQLLLAPSRSEGMPLVPMEAVEAGVPVLASHIDAHEELFAGAPGSLLDANPASWPQRLGALIEDPSPLPALALAQRSVLGDDPRASLWRAYEGLYRAVAEER